MVLGCGAKVLKYCLFAFNLVFFIAGIVCLGIGIYLIVDDHAIDQMMKKVDSQQPSVLLNKPHAVHDLGVIMAIGGAIILVIAFLGCCGAVKEWRPLLVLYAVCLMVILAIEIAAAIYAAVNRGTLETSVKGFMNDTLQFYDGMNNNASLVRAFWDQMMKDDKCCGVSNTTANDFIYSGWYKNVFLPRWNDQSNIILRQTKNSTDYFPAACCNPTDTTWQNDPMWINNQNDTVCYKDYRVQQGCYQKLKDGIESKLAIVIGVGAGVALIQLIGIIFSLCLCRAISDEYVG